SSAIFEPGLGQNTGDAQPLRLLANLYFQGVARVSLQLTRRAGAQEYCLRIERIGAARHRARECCERRLQLARAERIDAEQSKRDAAMRTLVFDLREDA